MTLYRDLPNIASRITAAPPRLTLARKVGVEIETQGNSTSLARAVRLAGLAHPSPSYSGNGACGYHCHDDDCTTFLVHPTTDCTVSGIEAVVGGPEGTAVNDTQLHLAVERLSGILESNGASVNRSCGGHIHVDRDDMGYDAAKRLIHNTHELRTELRLLMSAARRDGIRGGEESTSPADWDRYHGMNAASSYWSSESCIGDRGYWFWFTEYGTVEFRGWNGTIRAWRIIMGLYVSAGLVQAAVDGREANRGDGDTILSHLDGYLPDYVGHLVKRQFGYLNRSRYSADAQEIPAPAATA